MLCVVRVGPDDFSPTASGHLMVHKQRKVNAKCKVGQVLAFFPWKKRSWFRTDSGDKLMYRFRVPTTSRVKPATNATK